MRSSDFVLKTKKAMEDLFSRGGGVTTTLKDHPSGREGVSLELDRFTGSDAGHLGGDHDPQPNLLAVVWREDERFKRLVAVNSLEIPAGFLWSGPLSLQLGLLPQWPLRHLLVLTSSPSADRPPWCRPVTPSGSGL